MQLNRFFVGCGFFFFFLLHLINLQLLLNTNREHLTAQVGFLKSEEWYHGINMNSKI